MHAKPQRLPSHLQSQSGLTLAVGKVDVTHGEKKLVSDLHSQKLAGDLRRVT